MVWCGVVWCGVVWCFSAQRSCNTVREKPRTRERRRQAYEGMRVAGPSKLHAGGGQRSCQPRPLRRASGTGLGGASSRRSFSGCSMAAAFAMAQRCLGLLPGSFVAPLAGRDGCPGWYLSTLVVGPSGTGCACTPRLLEGRSSTKPASLRGLALCAQRVGPITPCRRCEHLPSLSCLLRPRSLRILVLVTVPLGCFVPLSLLGKPAIFLPWAFSSSVVLL